MDEYVGYKEIVLENEVADIAIQEEIDNQYGLLHNEYAIFKDSKDTVINIYKCNGDKLIRVPYKSLTGRGSKVKPRNIQQQLTMDMLYDPNTTIKILTGRFGTGKDFLMCSAAVDLVASRKFDKIVYVRNNIEVKDSKPIGFLPGGDFDKLLPWAMPLAEHVGGIDGLSMMISKDQLEIIHFGFIRGRDIKNSIIICSEAENMTKEHIQLLIGRVGEGSSLWINGDFKQCDMEVFRKNSGLMTAIDRLKGHPRFGYVKLIKTERSETAAMADLLD